MKKLQIATIAIPITVIGLAAGIHYIVVEPAKQEDALRNSYNLCRELLEKAEGNREITDFIYERAAVDRTKYHKGKTCREIIDEYKTGEE